MIHLRTRWTILTKTCSKRGGTSTRWLRSTRAWTTRSWTRSWTGATRRRTPTWTPQMSPRSTRATGTTKMPPWSKSTPVFWMARCQQRILNQTKYYQGRQSRLLGVPIMETTSTTVTSWSMVLKVRINCIKKSQIMFTKTTNNYLESRSCRSRGVKTNHQINLSDPHKINCQLWISMARPHKSLSKK